MINKFAFQERMNELYSKKEEERDLINKKLVTLSDIMIIKRKI